MFTKEDAYIGDFIIGLYLVIQDYEKIYKEKPKSIAIDSEHFRKVLTSGHTTWVNPLTHLMNNGVLVVEEARYSGTFTSCRSHNYKPRV